MYRNVSWRRKCMNLPHQNSLKSLLKAYWILVIDKILHLKAGLLLALSAKDELIPCALFRIWVEPCYFVHSCFIFCCPFPLLDHPALGQRIEMKGGIFKPIVCAVVAQIAMWKVLGAQEAGDKHIRQNMRSTKDVGICLANTRPQPPWSRTTIALCM